jgi:hypothetical protein
MLHPDLVGRDMCTPCAPRLGKSGVDLETPYISGLLEFHVSGMFPCTHTSTTTITMENVLRACVHGKSFELLLSKPKPHTYPRRPGHPH